MDKHCQQHDHSGSFMNGFLMGAIIGAAVVFFLFTEKGKKLLETIIAEGSDGFSELQALIQEEMDDEDEDQPVETVSKSVHAADHASREALKHTVTDVLETAPVAPRVKRFFKRAK